MSDGERDELIAIGTNWSLEGQKWAIVIGKRINTWLYNVLHGE